MTLATDMMTYSEFLEHAGVKGMKWGVRKDGPAATKPKRTDEEKADIRKKVIIASGVTLAVGAVVVGLILNRAKILESFEVKKTANLLLSDIKDNPGISNLADNGKRFIGDFIKEDVIIPSGTNFQRVASTLETSINSPKYATYIDEDVLTYRARFTSPFAKEGSKVFKTSLKAVSNTKIAGNESLVKTASRLANENSKLSGLMRAEAISSYKGQPNYKAMRDQIVKASNPEVAEKWLNLNAGGRWTSPTSKKLISELTKDGYAGFTDNVDSSGMTKHAVVLINNAILKVTGSELSSVDVKAAEKLLSRFTS